MVSFNTISTRKTLRWLFLVGSQSWGKLFFFLAEGNENTSHHFGKGKFTTPKNTKEPLPQKFSSSRVFFRNGGFFDSKRAGPFSRNENIKTPTICPIVKGKSFQHLPYLVGGFNPSEKYESKWESSPNRGENNTYLKPPPRYLLTSSLYPLQEPEKWAFDQKLASKISRGCP